jgi:hypothetical protein
MFFLGFIMIHLVLTNSSGPKCHTVLLTILPVGFPPPSTATQPPHLDVGKNAVA